MCVKMRSAEQKDVSQIAALVNRYAAENVMLPRTEQGIHRTINDWLVASDGEGRVVACGSLVPLTPALVEIRSLAVDESQQGTGLGSRLVKALIREARERDFAQVCALTLRASFFQQLGFAVVDRWSISPKVWQACIYCPKFHRCDEVAVLMDLSGDPVLESEMERSPGWNKLLKYGAWQPLKLAYQTRPGSERE